MATGDIYKPTYSRKVKGKKTGEVKTVKKYVSKWYAWISYRDGRKERKPLATDKSVAQRMLAELLRETDLAEAGLSDPYAEHRKRPLSVHLDAWETALRAKARNTPCAQRQVQQTVGRVRLVFGGCGFTKLGDINGSKVIDFIGGLQTDAPPTGGLKKRQKLSLQTLNYYLRNCKQFCRWSMRDRRSPDNPLIHLQGWNTRLDRRHDRRALTVEEIGYLLATTRASTWVYRDLTGVDRAALYSTALGSGLRVSELASLTVGSFRLDATPPVVRLLAAYAKNQKGNRSVDFFIWGSCSPRSLLESV